MSQPTIEFHRLATREARAAREWYAARSQQAADRFLQELYSAFDRIIAEPTRWPAYMHGTRRVSLRRYRYIVVYRVTPIGVKVIAIAHGSRRPGYWNAR